MTTSEVQIFPPDSRSPQNMAYWLGAIVNMLSPETKEAVQRKLGDSRIGGIGVDVQEKSVTISFGFE